MHIAESATAILMYALGMHFAGGESVSHAESSTSECERLPNGPTTQKPITLRGRKYKFLMLGKGIVFPRYNTRCQ